MKIKTHLTISKLIIGITMLIYLCFISYINYKRLGSFSFGDEWNNFVAGFFLNKEKLLFLEIFYNHQLLIPYMSYVIQFIFPEKSLYGLVFSHRMSLLFFSLFFDLLLILKFKKPAIFFTIIYETTKFYLFGHLFLAESFIVQPMIFLFAITWNVINKIKITHYDVFFYALCIWFVFFLREPYVLSIVFLSGVFLFFSRKYKFFSVKIFLTLFFFTVFLHYRQIEEYFYQVYFFNLKYMVPYELASTGQFAFFKGFFYPILIFFSIKWNYFYFVLFFLNVLFLIGIIKLIIQKKYKLFIFIFITLGLLNLRYISPGSVFYESFHLLPWYGLFIFITFFLLHEFFKLKHYLLMSFLITIFTLFNPNAFIWEKVNTYLEFNINYAHYYSKGNVINRIADSYDTLFTDQWDYLLHIVTGLKSSYKYSIYSFATTKDKYKIERMNMFKTNPPDIYYTFCKDGKFTSEIFPDFISIEYFQIYYESKPTCIFLYKNKLLRLNDINKKQMIQEGYTFHQYKD